MAINIAVEMAMAKLWLNVSSASGQINISAIKVSANIVILANL